MDEHGVEIERPAEPESTRLARNMAELLQELRVAQAGVQILFAFLLSVAFTNRFANATTFQRVTVIVTILLTTASAALLMAPVAWHRLYFRQGRRPEVINWGNRFTLGGLTLLAAAMTGAVLLVGDAVLGRLAAILIAVFAAVLFGSTWMVMPLVRRARAPRLDPPASGGAPGPREQPPGSR
jgi:hypothetical protein